MTLRKGHVYGTVLVDMEAGDVVDLLPDREAATMERWLKEHPGTAVICSRTTYPITDVSHDYLCRGGQFGHRPRWGLPGAVATVARDCAWPAAQRDVLTDSLTKPGETGWMRRDSGDGRRSSGQVSETRRKPRDQRDTSFGS
jgi:hypothetical protein